MGTPTMSGYFGLLPPELMRSVLDELNTVDVVSLMRSSKSLHSHVELELFRSKAARDDAMDWAICNAQHNIVRRLVDVYGASPSFFRGTVVMRNMTAGSRGRGRNAATILKARSTLVAVLKRSPDIETTMRVFTELGAVLDPGLCPRSEKDISEANFDLENLRTAWHQQKFTFARRMVSLPTKTEKQQQDKLAVLKYYFDTGRFSFRVEPSIVHSLPRFIRSDNDLPIVQFILLQDRLRLRRQDTTAREAGRDGNSGNAVLLDEAKPNDTQTNLDTEMTEPSLEIDVDNSVADRKAKSGGPASTEAPLTYPIVDRPERCGPHGAPLSPLSAAILCDAQNIFSLLLEHGADIDGPTLDFKKYGPTTHATHIPIFAAVQVFARRKRGAVVQDWIERCCRAGANINHMALCTLSGKHRPYQPVSSSLSYYAQGSAYPPSGCVYFWATPMDVYLDCLPLTYLRKRTVEPFDEDDNGYVRSVEVNMTELGLRGAVADCASLRAPPRLRDPDTSDIDAKLDSSTVNAKQRNTQVRPGPPLDVEMIYTGAATDPSLDMWRNWKRIVSPTTIEILLDRVTISGMAYPVASSYVEILKEAFGSGSGQEARLMSKYDGPAPESQFPSWTSGAESVGRRTLAMLLLCDDVNKSQSVQLHRYIVYAVRRADMLFMDKVLDNIEQVFSGPYSHIQVEGTFVASKRDDDVEYQCYLADHSKNPHINWHQQSPERMKDWTALHEICRLWNLQMVDYEKSRSNANVPDKPLPRFARELATTMKLLTTLVAHGLPPMQAAGNGLTPIAILSYDPESVLQPASTSLLNTIGDFMKTAMTLTEMKNSL
ncbi:hypothetical protein HMPREF1624_07416 [Sporothrix schenckii ATCC 58251]|uniref:F-box domain-containing protein n=1 Tax=Sporothrix schenckii (strain ATCC 58251 / de Perez 2211183) TaxID=1391915 RepID=U7PPU4_SPOS1|nr:hypothetical protein HMPREF1624_07416 [Sporothrix schenckii ATCC 58251]